MYDGTEYHGWQVQKKDRTVCGTVESALSKLTGETVKVTGCGRTDAGVHALSYCANFKSNTGIPLERLPLAVNSLLPPDIAVLKAVEVEDSFNSILSCNKKEYTYRIVNSRIRDPFLKNRVYFYPSPLDDKIMKSAASQFVGTHDFAAVRSVGTETKTTVRTIYYCDIERNGQEITMKVCADGFLYNMVRAIMGTVIYCAEGKIDPKDIPMLLETRDRRLTGPTVPPQGLYMSHIWYDGPAGELMS
jgi:tRNA pseudouridine38-40 synthase